MAEAARQYEDPYLAESRLLTEVEHFLEFMDESGSVPAEAFEAVVQNRKTAVAEIAMPYAVTTTEHEVSERTLSSGRLQRTIWWLGRSALQVAESGYQHHFSEPAYRRVDIEKREAVYGERSLRHGVAQVFISPRMTSHDATPELAKAEHLYADDSLRVSTAITNDRDEVIGRKLQSLLVRDIPFDAWVKMLEDPANIFGKSFDLRDNLSAVSVMELFSQMELPEDKLPEGPVTLIEAVVPYIGDELARQKVKQQLKRFRGDQEHYAHEAELAGDDWTKFDLELARSLRKGRATDKLRFFIMGNANAWNDEALAIIEACELGNTQYQMTRELAALLGRAKQKLVGDELSVATENDRATEHVSAEALHLIKAAHQELVHARISGADPALIYTLEQRQYQLLHQQPIKSGGGCPGDVDSTFGSSQEQAGVGEANSPFKTSAEDKSSWKWKQGVCQVKSCPSPKPTEVGPCSVCRHCQAEFDKGRDPTRGVSRSSKQQIGAKVIGLQLFRNTKKLKQKVAEKDKLLTAG